MKLVKNLVSFLGLDIVFQSKRNMFFASLLLISYFILLYTNTFHEEYPDEFDNILGGKYIVHGILPFSGFFSHHGPVAYFVGALVYLFSGNSFVRFRVIYSVFLFLLTVGSYIFLQKSVGKKETKFYIVSMFMLAIVSSYYWLHMLVADSLAAYFLAPVIALLVLKSIYNKLLSTADLIFISCFSSLGLLTALTHLYVVVLIYGYTIYKYFLDDGFRFSLRRSTQPFIILGLPYIFFALYLVVTNSFSDYLYQNIVFNQKYYIYNYDFSSPEKRINPIRYGVIILHNFYNNFTNLLLQSKDFNFGFPANIALAIANVGLMIYLLFKKKYTLTLFFFLILAFANVRSNPLDSGEKDYQAAVYIIISLLSIPLCLSSLYKELSHEQPYAKKLVFSVLFLVVSIYTIAGFRFFISKFEEKSFYKYMGQAPRIYDRPQIAPVLNTIITKDDYVWMGPLEFKEYIYLEGEMPSKYHILIPGMGRSQKIQDEILKDFSTHLPTIVYLDKRYAILGEDPMKFAGFFLQFLNDHYITLYEYREKNMQYKSKLPITDRLDLETKLYILKEHKDATIKKMLSENLIEKVPQSK